MTARRDVPFDPNVVAPWTLGSGRRGALLLHGFAGTPPELRRLGERLAAAGWVAHGPLLAGHGTTPENLERTTWRDWAASAHAALDDLSARCDAVVVAGQSMGGTLALHLAATDTRVRAVATLAAPVRLSDRRLVAIGILQHLRRWHVPDPDDVDLYWRDAVDQLHSYGRRSLRSIHELVRLLAVVRDELAMVRQPVLLLHGARDRSVDPSNVADIARRLLCSAEVATHIYPRSGHALSVDVDHEDVEARVLAWFDRFVPPDATTPSMSVGGAKTPA